MAIKPYGVDAASGSGQYAGASNKIDPSALDIATGADVTAGTANKLLDASKVVQTLGTLSSTVPSSAAVDTAITNALTTVFVPRGDLASGSNISTNTTGNAYIDGNTTLAAYSVFFITGADGVILTSTTSIPVQTGDILIIKNTVARASIVPADVQVNDASEKVTSVFGRIGTVVAVAGDYTASQVTNVPAGNIAAVTVQAALNELDAEKVATTTAIKTPVNSGLAGGGDLSTSRSLVLDYSNLPVVTSAAAADLLVVSVAGVESAISKANFVSDVSALLSTTTAIDLKTVGSTALYTVPSGKTLVQAYAVVRITAASAITAAATVGFGSNGTQDNLAFPQEMFGTFAAGDKWDIVPLGKGVVVAAAGVVSFGVDVAATGTSQVATVYFFGTVV
jgi:hypothetical protein